MLNISFWNIAFTIINVLVLLLFMRHFLMKPVMAKLLAEQSSADHDKKRYDAFIAGAGENHD